MKPASDEETKESIEFVRSKMADQAAFERWANELLDRAHGHRVGRRRR